MTDLHRWGLVGSCALFLTATLASCGPAGGSAGGPSTGNQASTTSKPPSATPSKTAGPAADRASAAPGKAFDPCDGSEPVPHPFFGILEDARCEQDMFLQMASVADQLGVECTHCHLPHPTEAKKEDYPPMTPKKEVANWMHEHLMQAVKPADGSPMKCRSCHVDTNGKPVVKILGNPRDAIKAQEWMSLVMVNKFVTRNGDKLKCKSCHVGNFTTPQFQAKVILRTEQIPPH